MGSSPIASTSGSPSPSAIAGFVAGEGSFSVTTDDPPTRKDGSRRLRFVFGVAIASRDRPLLVAMQAMLGVGCIEERRSSNPRWQPISRYSISSRLAHRNVTIPFFEEHLLPCAKRMQFDRWRERFSAYEEAHPTRIGFGPSSCSAPGCDRPVRGRGLCRSHYYSATGY